MFRSFSCRFRTPLQSEAKQGRNGKYNRLQIFAQVHVSSCHPNPCLVRIAAPAKAVHHEPSFFSLAPTSVGKSKPLPPPKQKQIPQWVSTKVGTALTLINIRRIRVVSMLCVCGVLRFEVSAGTDKPVLNCECFGRGGHLVNSIDSIGSALAHLGLDI